MPWPAFPSYQVQIASTLVGDPSGRPIPLAGDGVLTVTFRQAQAHTASGAPSVVTQPPARLGLSRMVSWARGTEDRVSQIGQGACHRDPLTDLSDRRVGRILARSRGGMWPGRPWDGRAHAGGVSPSTSLPGSPG